MKQKNLFRGMLSCASGICAVFCLTAGASAAEPDGSWQQNGDRRSYVCADESAAAGTVSIDGTDYLFAPNGIQQVGWQTVREQRRYYDPATGEPVTGWLHWRGADYYISPESGKLTGIFSVDDAAYLTDECGVLQKNAWCTLGDAWYYGDAEGKPVSGETVIDGAPYLFSAEHRMLTGWQTPSDGILRRYDSEPDGTPSVQTGWFDADGHRYYAEAETGLLHGLQTIDAQTYLFDDSGIMQTGFCPLDGKTMYFAPDGAMQKGWITLDDQTYYADADGGILTGFQTITDTLYDFDETGAMLTGWQTADNQKYYFDAQKGALHGLQQIGAAQYYFDATGIMQTGSVDAGGVYYYLDADGKRIDGFHTSEAGRTYISPLTGTTVTGWQTIDSAQYYFDADGIAATGTITLDGQNYRFADDGAYHPVKICLDAGHYAKYNRSPVNPTYYESDFNWKMHLYLKEELEKYNITVITTREDKETDLPLEDRGKTSAGCDLFLSIHSNASTNAYDDGPLACCTITGTCDQLGLDLANLVADVMGTRQRGSIWKRYGEKYPDLNYYGVLRGATYVNTPSILLEHSYHTNLRATNWLLNDANVRKLAAAEGRFLAEYFGQIPPAQTDQT